MAFRFRPVFNLVAGLHFIIFYFLSLWVVRPLAFADRLIFKLAHNVLKLQEVGDFYLNCAYEERMFVPPQNCHTKH